VVYRVLKRWQVVIFQVRKSRFSARHVADGGERKQLFSCTSEVIMTVLEFVRDHKMTIRLDGVDRWWKINGPVGDQGKRYPLDLEREDQWCRVKHLLKGKVKLGWMMFTEKSGTLEGERSCPESD